MARIETRASKGSPSSKKKRKKRKPPVPRQDVGEMAERIRNECRSKGMSHKEAVDYAIRCGLLRQDAVEAADIAYGRWSGSQWIRFVPGGRVSSR